MNLRECCKILDVRPPVPRRAHTFEQARDALAEWKAGELKHAYRRVAKAAHPDLGGPEERMKLVNEAYELLKTQLIVRRPSRPMRTGFTVLHSSTATGTTTTTWGPSVRPPSRWR